jgi:competence protein ComEA
VFLALLLLALLVLLWRRGPSGFLSWPEGTSVSPLPPDPFVVEVEGSYARSGIYAFPAQVGIEEVLLRAGVAPERIPTEACSVSLKNGTKVYLHPSGPGLRLQTEPMDSAKKILYGIPLDLNQVGPDELTLIPGIGPTLSRRIIDYREHAGPFVRIEDLLHVSGIGKKKLDSLRPYLSVENNSPAIP